MNFSKFSFSFSFSFLFGFLSLLFFFACETAPQSSSSEEPSLPLSADLRYQAIVGITGVPISESSPVWDDLAAVPTATYRIQPDLPIGLTLNTSTGTISGKPSAASPSADYTVTATGTGSYTGSSSARLLIGIENPLTESLRYQAIVGVQGLPISESSPIWGDLSAVPTATYRIQPELPNGLTLNTSTGTISGKPTAVLLSADYTVTATGTGNYTGSSSAQFTINITTPLAESFRYQAIVGVKEVAISETSPIWDDLSAIPTATYRIEPELPNGLTFNTSTGAISGKPTTVLLSADYMLTATGTGTYTGSSSAQFTISITTPLFGSVSYKNVSVQVHAPFTTIEPIWTEDIDVQSVTYRIQPSLPNGLMLNTSTGAISGKPTTVLASTSYQITVTGKGIYTGSQTSTIVIEVRDAAEFSYTHVAYGTSDTRSPVFTRGDASDGTFRITTSGKGIAQPILPKIDEPTGTITIDSTTTAGTYMVMFSENTEATPFYVTEQPETISTLESALETGIKYFGLSADYNYLHTDKMTTMKGVFSSYTASGRFYGRVVKSYIINFHGDISAWDTSAVTNMDLMFYNAQMFNGDISNWEVSTVETMISMFGSAKSFNNDISNWEVGTLQDITRMFVEAIAFDKNLDAWGAHFTVDSSTGKTTELTKKDAFINSGLAENEPTWY